MWNGAVSMIYGTDRLYQSLMSWRREESPGRIWEALITYLRDVVVQPLCALFSGDGAVVSIVEGRQLRKDIRHALRRDGGEQGLDEVAVRERGKV